MVVFFKHQEGVTNLDFIWRCSFTSDTCIKHLGEKRRQGDCERMWYHDSDQCTSNGVTTVTHNRHVATLSQSPHAAHDLQGGVSWGKCIVTKCNDRCFSIFKKNQK